MVNNLLVHFYFSNFWVFHSNLLIIILRQAPHILHPSSMIFTYLQFRTPHIDSLFASSLTLPSFYTSSPVCIRIALFAAYKEQVKTKGVLTLSCLLPYWITCCHQVERYIFVTRVPPIQVVLNPSHQSLTFQRHLPWSAHPWRPWRPSFTRSNSTLSIGGEELLLYASW